VLDPTGRWYQTPGDDHQPGDWRHREGNDHVGGNVHGPEPYPGLYKISVEAKGFKSFLLKDINVSANQDNVADAKLDLGVATEIVEVSSGAVEIQTTSSSLNNTFDTRDPDCHRSPMPVTPPGLHDVRASTASRAKLPLSAACEVGNPESRVSNVLFREDDVVWISTARSKLPRSPSRRQIELGVSNVILVGGDIDVL